MAAAFTFKEGWGIYVGDKEVYFARAAYTLKGKGILETIHRTLADKPLAAQLAETLHIPTPEELTVQEAAALDASEHPEANKSLPKPSLAARLKALIPRFPLLLDVGVPDNRVFFSMLPTPSPVTRKTDLQALISENPRTAFLSMDHLITDWTGTQIGEQHFAIVGAARRTHIRGLLQTFDSFRLQPLRMEPGPWAALRALWQTFPPLLGPGNEFWIVIGEKKILVALCQGSLPLGWQVVERDPESAVQRKLESILRQLMTYSRWTLKAPEAARVTLCGPAVPEQWAKGVSDIVQVPARSIAGPAYDGELVARGLALGSLSPDASALNLARFVQKPLSLMALLPRFESLVAALVIGFVLIVMGDRSSTLSRHLHSLKRENAQAAWAIGKNPMELDAINRKLRVEAILLEEYLVDRTAWAPIFEELSRLLPEKSLMGNLEAEDQIWLKNSASKDLGERYLLVRMGTPLPPNGEVPGEIDSYLAALRLSPLFMKNFPRVQLASINWRKDFGAEMAYAMAMCVPAQIKQTGELPSSAPPPKEAAK